MEHSRVLDFFDEYFRFSKLTPFLAIQDPEETKVLELLDSRQNPVCSFIAPLRSSGYLLLVYLKLIHNIGVYEFLRVYTKRIPDMPNITATLNLGPTDTYITFDRAAEVYYDIVDENNSLYSQIDTLDLDISHWNPSYSPIQCLTTWLFSEIFQSSTPQSLSAVYNEESLTMIEAMTSGISLTSPNRVQAYISTRHNYNWISRIVDHWTIESEHLRKLLEHCSGHEPDHPMTRIGVLALNNCIAILLQPNTTYYLIKNKVTQGDHTYIQFRQVRADDLRQIMLPLKNYRIGPKGKDIGSPWYSIWISHPDRAIVSNSYFKPFSILHPEAQIIDNKGPYRNVRSFNLFSGYQVTLEELKAAYHNPIGQTCITGFKRLLHEGFCNRNSVYSEYLTNWLAWLVQEEKRSKVSTVIKTQQGVGKGLLAKIICYIYGNHAVSMIAASFFSQFMGYVEHLKFVLLDELGSNAGDMNHLKHFLSEESTFAEKKFGNRTKVDLFLECLMTTNVHINWSGWQNESRRFFVLEGAYMPNKELSDWKVFMTELWDNIFEHPEHKDAGARAIWYYLLSVDIRKFDPRRDLPITDYLKKLMTNSLPSAHGWWKHILERQHLLHNQTTGGRLDESVWNFKELHTLYLSDTVYWSNRKKSTEAVGLTIFVSEMENVLSITKTGEDTFRLSTWAQQYHKWATCYSNIPLNVDHDVLINLMHQDPYSLSFYNKLDNQSRPAILNSYTKTELLYIIGRMNKALKKRDITTEFTPTVMAELDPSRRNYNSELVLFKNTHTGSTFEPRKRRRTESEEEDQRS